MENKEGIMVEKIFEKGDFVRVIDNVIDDDINIGYILGRDNHTLFGENNRYRDRKYSYDIVVERNGKRKLILKHAIDSELQLLAKCGTVASKALALSLDAHEGQVDKAGVDYSLHIITVGEFVKEITTKDEVLAVAYLHDVLEDTNVTEEELNELFSVEIVEAVKALTREKYEPYQFYLERVKGNDWATIVKLSDIKHNSDMERLKKKLKTSIGWRDFKRMRKYQDAIKYLEEK